MIEAENILYLVLRLIKIQISWSVSWSFFWTILGPQMVGKLVFLGMTHFSVVNSDNRKIPR